MVDLTDLTALFDGTKTAVDTLAGIKSLKNDPKAREALDKLERELMQARAFAGEAQVKVLKLAQKNKDIQSELDSSKAWQSSLERYEEVPYGAGKSVHRLKREHNSYNDERYACPKCLGMKKIMHLQFQNRTYQGLDYYKCYDCNGEFFYGTLNEDSGVRTVSRGDWNPFDY